jgi:iron complex outermembrane recepter protein
LALLAAGPVAAPAPQRIEITGSSIKRADAETALPVRFVTRDEILRSGGATWRRRLPWPRRAASRRRRCAD